MSDELKITKETVLKAASKCPTAKEVLKELFPEVFEDTWELYRTVSNQDFFTCTFLGESGYLYQLRPLRPNQVGVFRKACSSSPSSTVST